VLPEVRKSLRSEDASVRARAIRIVAWQGDAGSLEQLRAMHVAGGVDATSTAWAIEKIELFQPTR
jgi:hypothetical protein